VPATRRGLCEVPEESDRILEDDIITIWGECDGLYSYESVLGSKVSLPKIDVKYYSIDNKNNRLYAILYSLFLCVGIKM